MAVTAWGQVFIQASMPQEDPVQVGSIWVDTVNVLVKQCTSVSPYTFATVSGTGALADGDYGDVTVSGSGAVITIDNDVVSDAKLRNSSALSVIGRSANSTGDPADIAAGSDHQVLRRSGAALGFGAVDVGQSAAVTGRLPYANLTAATAAALILGRGNGGGAGDWQEISFGPGLTMVGTSMALDIPGSDTQIIFNDGGSSLGADAGLTYNKTTDTLTVAGDLNVGGGDIIGTADTTIRRNTSDASDNGFMRLAGGGAAGVTRGAQVTVHGNESGAPGRIDLEIGNVANSKLSIWKADGAEVLKILGSDGVVEFMLGQLKFPATQNASSNANTLDDFEKGTWTPVDNSGAGLTFSAASGVYVKVGPLVAATLDVTYPSTANASQVRISLPFSTETTLMANGYGSMLGYTDASIATITPLASGASAFGYKNNDGSALTNANMSLKNIRFTCLYRTA